MFRQAITQDAQKDLEILVATTNPSKLKAVQEAFNKYFDKVKLNSQSVNSRVSDTPLTEEETLQGINNRLEEIKKQSGYNFYIAIEAGVQEINNTMYLFTWVGIYNGQKTSYGRSISYPLPQKVSKLLKKGKDLAVIAAKIAKEDDIRSKGGFISYASKNVLTRTQLTKDAIICALLPFINKIYE